MIGFVALYGGGFVMITMLFVSNMMLAIITTVDRKNARKIFLHHPSLLLLPTFTLFTFQRVNLGLCNKVGRGVKFSWKFTIVNFVLSIVCCGIITATIFGYRYPEVGVVVVQLPILLICG